MIGSCNSEGGKSPHNLIAIFPLSKTSDGVCKTVMSQKESSFINKKRVQSSRSNLSHLIQCIPVITKSLFSFTSLVYQQNYYWDYAADARVPFQNIHPCRICPACIILLKLQYLISSSEMYLIYKVCPSGHSMKPLLQVSVWEIN